MLRMTAAVALATATILASPAAFAQAGVKIGELRCHTGRDVGLIIGSREALECAFTNLGGSKETYAGTITKLGLDVGVTEGGTLLWGVLAPASNIAPGALNGDYFGADAAVTAGVGVGANVLVGGFNHSLTLQPLSVEGDKGAAISAGVEELRLKLK